jgi:hypothetical protein
MSCTAWGMRRLCLPSSCDLLCQSHSFTVPSTCYGAVSSLSAHSVPDPLLCQSMSVCFELLLCCIPDLASSSSLQLTQLHSCAGMLALPLKITNAHKLSRCCPLYSALTWYLGVHGHSSRQLPSAPSPVHFPLCAHITLPCSSCTHLTLPSLAGLCGP